MAWILCGRLHATLSYQSLLMAMLHSLIARRRFGPQTQWRPFRKALTSGLGLDDMSLTWSAVVQILVFIYSDIELAMSTRLCISLWLIWFLWFVFALMHWLSWETLCEPIFCVSVLRVASGPRVKLASCKSALNPPVVCSTDLSKAVVPVLILVFVALWFILRDDLLYVFPCVILCFSVLLVLRLPRLGKRELI